MPRKKVADTLDRRLLNPNIQRRIESAVLELFSDRPVSQVGFSEIAKSANTSLQTIYRYYGSKEALLSASLEHWMGQLSSRVSEKLSGIDHYKERMRKGFATVLDYFEEHPKVALLAQLAFADKGSESGDPLVEQQFSKLILTELEKGQREGLLNKEVSGAILFDYFAGVFIRLVQTSIVKGPKESVAAQANTLFELLWRAIANPHHDQFSA